MNGLARLRASGFDTALNVVPFNPRTARPSFGSALCSNVSSSTTEEYLVEVQGKSYTVQIGGVDRRGRVARVPLRLPGRHGRYGVLDTVDRCDRIQGPAGTTDVRATSGWTRRYGARPTPDGIEIDALAVTAKRGSKVVVTCSAGCRRQSKRAHSVVKFPALHGVALRAGTSSTYA